MPIHDWTQVSAGVFHDFHHGWIEEIKRVLNDELLPHDHYAMAEQITGHLGPDVLTLKTSRGPSRPDNDSGGGVAVAERPPKVRFHQTMTEADFSAAKAKAVVIRHSSGHEVIAMIEIVSPGNKSSQRTFDAFIDKAEDALRGGIHLLIVDLFPPGPRDPQGIHAAIWGDRGAEPLELPHDQRLTCAAYLGGLPAEAFVEPVAVGDDLPDMPLFLNERIYVPVPLERTYRAAWEAVPRVWRDSLTSSAG